MNTATWSWVEARELCTRIEAIAPVYGCHVGLTGGLLYKDGPRKDLDIIFYRIRQVEAIDWDGLMLALKGIGFMDMRFFGFVTKAIYEGRSLDILFPEYGVDSDYQKEDEESPRHETPVVSEAMRQQEISSQHPMLVDTEF